MIGFGDWWSTRGQGEVRMTFKCNEEHHISKENEVLGKGIRKVVLVIMILSCHVMLVLEI